MANETGIPIADEIAAHDEQNRQTMTFRLENALLGAGFTVTRDTKPPRVHVKDDDGNEDLLTIDCDRRASDGGRLWFTSDGKPICEADDLFGCIVWVKGRAAGNP